MPLFLLFNSSGIPSKSPIAAHTKASTSRRVVGGSSTTHVCPQCLVDDEGQYGSAYLHRAHQIPGVTACWRHERSLIERCPECDCPYSLQKEFVLSAWHGCTCGLSTKELVTRKFLEPTKVEVEFAKFAHDLLNRAAHIHHSNLTNSQIRMMYMRRIQQLGLGWGNDRVNRQKMLKRVRALFGAALLSRIDGAFKTGKMSGWFRTLETSSIETPLNRHLICSFFLFRSVDRFLALADLVLKDEQQQHMEARQGNGASKRAIKSGPALGQDSDEEKLMASLVQTALRLNYDVKLLWKHNFGSMQRLVKAMPMAIQVLQSEIKASRHRHLKKVSAPAPASSTVKETDPQEDLQWRDALILAAKSLYEEETRPFRISANRILKAASFRPKGTRFPTEGRFPLARAAAIAYGEGIWHFYARRMLWTLQGLVDSESSASVVMKLSGLELYKGKAVLEHFATFGRSAGSSIAGVNTVLSTQNIGLNWAGPCPERAFYASGRAYRLRTTRRGDIGDKASDRRVVGAANPLAL